LVLATQNPVDLDYKALSNAGTWFIGRLQTERDKMRLLDGLEGASASSGLQFDRQDTERILSGLGNRVFMLNNVHEDEPVIFNTRWAMSYLRGPLTREQIRTPAHSATIGRKRRPPGHRPPRVRLPLLPQPRQQRRLSMAACFQDRRQVFPAHVPVRSSSHRQQPVLPGKYIRRGRDQFYRRQE
jgi:hypothetical protein